MNVLRELNDVMLVLIMTINGVFAISEAKDIGVITFTTFQSVITSTANQSIVASITNQSVITIQACQSIITSIALNDIIALRGL